MVDLTGLAPAAVEGWWFLLDLTAEEPHACLLVGGQMVHVLIVEHGGEPVRTTVDVDVVVNVRIRPDGTRWLSSWLTARAFEFAGASPDGVGHRFTRPATLGPGTVIFDVLGPDGLGSRTSLTTAPPARTIEVPGATQALRRSELVAISATGAGARDVRMGQVRRPSLLGALVAKAAATTIAARSNPERDWQDAAILSTLIDDPRSMAAACDRKDRQRLRRLRPLSDLTHNGWDGIDRHARRQGAAALSFLID